MAEYDLAYKDFSLPEAELQPKRFKVGPEQFTAPPQIGALTIARLVGAANQLTSLGASLSESQTNNDPVKMAEQIEGILTSVGDFFVELLDDEDTSGERFKAALLRKKNPLDLNKQVFPIIHWLLEVYGLRPTEASSPSSNGSEDAGPGSTDGAASEASPL